MPAQNFTVKLNLDEANIVRDALRAKLQGSMKRPVGEMTEDERAEIARIELILRRDFG